MARAVELSRKGWPAPNPHVGCVIAKKGRVIAEGWHEYAGGPHAEAMALAGAGAEAHGSDVYVTLEPCAHFGRTPPCAAALVSARVNRVIYAVPDPNPKAEGGGRMLAESRIQVQVGLLRDEAVEANFVWLTSQLLQRPFVILKAAVTRDGFMAKLDGTSKWITSAQSREIAHKLRAEMGSVLVGWKTVLLDDPELTARIPGVVNQPRAVVLDPQRRLSGHERVLRREGTLWVSGSGMGRLGSPELSLSNGKFQIHSILSLLRSEGITGVLVEGGAGVLASFQEAGIWDELHVFVGQKEFFQGLAAPSELLGLALNSESREGLVHAETQSLPDEDRHIQVKNLIGSRGTIQDWLGSIPNS